MNKNNNIIRLSRIKNCIACGGHFKVSFSKHILCNQCYYGDRQGKAIAKAVQYQEMAKCP